MVAAAFSTSTGLSRGLAGLSGGPAGPGGGAGAGAEARAGAECVPLTTLESEQDRTQEIAREEEARATETKSAATIQFKHTVYLLASIQDGYFIFIYYIFTTLISRFG